MIIADANLIIYRYLRGPLSGLADRVVRKDEDWRTSTLWRVEFASAAVKMIRGGVVGEADAIAAMTLASHEMSTRELHVPQARVIRIAVRHGISAYDAQYAALAEAFGVICVSADATFTRKAPQLVVSISDFVK